MSKVSIYHDAERFGQEIALVVYKGKALEYVDVVSRDGRPGELLAVVRDYGDPFVWYSNAKVYSTYQHAFAAIGAAIDKHNPGHQPLSGLWGQ